MSKGKKRVEKKAVGYGEMSVSELREKLVSYEKELFNLRFQKVMGELKNTSRVSVVRKDVARIHTALTKKAMGSKK